MKRPLTLIAATAAVALFAWTLLWTWGARHVAARFEAWRAAQAEAGVTVGYGSFAVKGWPFGWRVTIETPAAAGSGAAGWAWSGERLVASVDPRDLRRIAIRLPGAQQARFGAGDVATRLDIRAARPEGTLRFDDAGRIERLDLDFEALELRLDGAAETLQVRHLAFGLAPHRPAAADHRTDTLDVTLRAAGVRLPAAVRPLEALGRDVASAELDARVMGRIAGTRLAEAVRIWRDDGGTLEIAKLAVDWGPLRVEGDGTLALDERDRPLGAGTARIAGYAETLDTLVAGGAVPPGMAAVAKIALNLLARQDPQGGGRPTVRVPVSAQDGVVTVQNFRLFRVGPLAFE